jgi:hypothetical protein
MSAGRGVTLTSDPRFVVSAFNTAIRRLVIACVASAAMAGPASASPPGAKPCRPASNAGQ